MKSQESSQREASQMEIERNLIDFLLWLRPNPKEESNQLAKSMLGPNIVASIEQPR